MIGHYGLSPTQYGLTFSLNAAAFIGVAQFNGAIGRIFGLKRMVRIAVAVYATIMVCLLLITLAGSDNLYLLMTLLMMGYGCLGLINPTVGVLALEHHGAIAGTASALLGTIQFVVGSLVMAIVGYFADGDPLPMIVGIAGCAICALCFARLTLGGNDPTEEPKR